MSETYYRYEEYRRLPCTDEDGNFIRNDHGASKLDDLTGIELIRGMRDMPTKCDVCGQLKEPEELDPVSGGEWLCFECGAAERKGFDELQHKNEGGAEMTDEHAIPARSNQLQLAPQPVGRYVMAAGTHAQGWSSSFSITMYRKPRWTTRFLMRVLLEFHWEE